MNALAPIDHAASTPHAPANLAAEQALLGSVLFDNSAMERVPDHFRADHLFEPFHQRLYASMVELVGKGKRAEPIILMSRFESDPAFHELGGLSYLADLAERGPPAHLAKDFADEIYDLALRRELQRIGQTMAAGVVDGHTPALEQVAQAEEELYALAEHGETSKGLQAFSTHARTAVDMAAEAYSRDGGLSGVSTGLIDLDKLIGGLHPSDLVILAGRPSMGKSALAVNIAFNIAKAYTYQQMPDGTRKTTAGGRVAFYSLEMSGDQLASRILADASSVPADRVRKGDIQAHEFGRFREAADLLDQIPLYIDDTGALSIGKLCARARRMKRRHGLELVVVDYLQLATVPGLSKGKDNRVQEVSAITMALKALAKELSVPVIALSQLSRQVESRDDKRPQLSDLRESGSIEQDADMVWFVYREAYYLGRAEPKEQTPEHLAWQEELDRVAHLGEVIIGKQRHGPIGTVKLHFNADLTRFSNLARGPRFDPATKPIDFKKLSAGDEA